MTEENVKKMKVSDLRAALTLRGLSTEGLKVDLVNRLQARLDEEEFGMIDAPISVPVITDNNNSSIAIIVETPSDLITTTTLTHSEIIQEDIEHGHEPSFDPTHDADAADADILVPVEENTSTIESSSLPFQEDKPPSNVTPTTVAIKSVPNKTATMTMEEKLKARAERFQMSESLDNEKESEETEKKRKRAERFLSEEERKKQSRAKRFQTSLSVSDGNTSNDNEETNDDVDVDDEERKKQLRAKRFQTTKSNDTQQQDNIIVDNDEEEEDELQRKKESRAKRFQQSLTLMTPNSVVPEEGGNSKPKKVTQGDTLPSKEELEKRLGRLEKFGKEANKVAIDEIKSMLRKHRFVNKT